jgi:isocitrate dehydrogenase
MAFFSSLIPNRYSKLKSGGWHPRAQIFRATLTPVARGCYVLPPEFERDVKAGSKPMASFNGVEVPADGQRITIEGKKLIVLDFLTIPFIEGDGTGRDIWRESRRVFDAAVEKAYGGARRVIWYEIFAGEKAFNRFGQWLPEDTVKAIAEFAVAIKGPLTTPIGGIRSLNVTLRQVLDFTPVCGQCVTLMVFPIRTDSGIGVKPISPTGTKRLVRCAIEYALDFGKPSVTLMHKGNIMKFTEGAFRDWGYELAKEEFRDQIVTERESWILDNREKNPSISDEENARSIEPGFDQTSENQRAAVIAEVSQTLASIWNTHGDGKWKKKLLIKDRIADPMFQQILTRPDEYSVIAMPNLNGDYISDAVAAQVGGLGMAPGANIGDRTAIFEATHGTAPKYADKDMVNPSSVILSGAMMFDHIGWREVSKTIIAALTRTIQRKRVTYDLHRQMEGATKLKTSEFALAIIENM